MSPPPQHDTADVWSLRSEVLLPARSHLGLLNAELAEIHLLLPSGTFGFALVWLVLACAAVGFADVLRCDWHQTLILSLDAA